MNNGKNEKLNNLTVTALFMALVCVVTMVIKIPIPSLAGYIHPGDTFVFLAGALLCGPYGLLAAGIGSALADLFSGYVIYAPVTFGIKLAAAAATGVIYRKMNSKGIKPVISLLTGSIAGLCIVCAGYFAYECILYGPGASAISLLFNLIQGGVGTALACLLLPFLQKIVSIKK